ncbi:TRAP transporter substrate-binding protein DctP [Corynebacterium lemuris]
MLKKRVGSLIAFLAIPLMLVGCTPAVNNGASDDTDRVVITMASGFSQTHSNNEGLWMFVEKLEENAPWITVDFKGGPEVMAPNLLIEGVAAGVFDIGVMPGDYYVDQIPAMEIARFTPFTPMEERENGVVEIYDEIHRDQLGIKYLGRAVAGMPQVILSRREITELDLHGDSYRTSSATSDIVRAINGVPVDLPGGEVYTALERNVVSGATWASVGPTSLGLEGVVSYDLAPRFYESLSNIVMNERSWDSLDERTQNALVDTLAEVEPDIFAHYLSRTIEETEQWHDAGVQEARLSDGDGRKLLELAYVDSWENLDWDRILETSPAAAHLREAFDTGDEELTFDRVPSGAFVSGIREDLEANR